MKTVIFLSMVLICSIFTEIMAQIPSSPPASGNGTFGNPYTIASLGNLRWIAEDDSRWSYHYKQTTHINATATGQGGVWGTTGWEPIAEESNYFIGTYDGQGWQINNLYCNRPDESNIGLFGTVSNAVIKNVVLKNATIVCKSTSGVLAGYVEGGIISRCFVGGTINCANGDNVGGCIGNLFGGTGASITECGSEVNVTSNIDDHSVGGFIGGVSNNFDPFLIKDCYSIGSVTNSYSKGGGFVGSAYNTDEDRDIVNCFSTGAVSNAFGGFAGFRSGDDDYWFKTCFFDMAASGAVDTEGGWEINLTATMKSINLYTNLEDAWDFIGTYNNDEGLENTWNLNGTTNNGYPFLSWQTHTWIGSVDSDWHTAANWFSGKVPASTGDGSQQNTVSISLTMSQPVIEEYVGIPNLIISSGNILTVRGACLNVQDLLVNHGSASNLSLELVENGSEIVHGRLLHYSPSVEATLHHKIPASEWTTWDDGWHEFSCPAVESPINAWHTPGTGGPLEGDFYFWSESTHEWINRTLVSGMLNPDFETDFIAGKGYLVATKNDVYGSFEGTFNTTDVVTPLCTKTGNNTHTGWNLVGNPFPCGLLWDDGNYDLTNFGSVAGLWDEKTKDYITIEGDGMIPPCQGFVVYTTTNQTLTIPKDSRTVYTEPWYKQVKKNQRIELIAHDSMGASAKRTVIKMNADATPGFDLKYDAFFLSGYAPKFFSIAEESRFSLNTLPVITNETVIPLGFIKNNSVDFSIELADKFDALPHMVLFDVKTGIEHDFSNGRYYFTSETNDPVNRFFLKFASVGVNDIYGGKKPEAWFHRDLLYVRQQCELLNIQIFSIEGKCIRTIQSHNSGLKTISLNDMPFGIYFVRISGNNETKTLKIKI